MHFFEPLFDTSQSHQNIMFICFLIGAYYFYKGGLAGDFFYNYISNPFDFDIIPTQTGKVFWK